MGPADIAVRELRRLEYERLVECGFFQSGDPVELVDGRLIVAEPQGSRHFATIQAVEEALRAAFGRGWQVRAQGPLAVDDRSLPEPDVAVVPGSYRDYVSAHPASPVLIVEVSESSLLLDRHYKGGLYARSGFPDYWIVNLIDRVLEVYRQPGPDPAASLGHRYWSVAVLAADMSVSPLARPGVDIRVADLFP
jgi:Uma2 family endonuclease